MTEKILLLGFVCLFSVHGNSQTLSDIFIAVDTLYMPGAAPGALTTNSIDVSPIITSSPCEMPQLHFSLATEYLNGKVLAIGHESLLADGSIPEYDNLTFVRNAMDWLNPGNKRVSIREGWVNNNNTSILQDSLILNGYTFGILNTAFTASSLANTDILLLGNDWNGQMPYSATELAALESFVANGGSVLIAGLGWSWPQTLGQYPMNQVANLFEMDFITAVINDSDHNIAGSPLLYHFFPGNLNTSQSPYCPSPFLGNNIGRGDTLRILRMAVSTTGEFTQQSGGVGSAILLLEPWLEEINRIFGREYCVRFELVPNNDLLVFPDPVTDPWGTLPGGSGGCTNAGIILSQQGSVIDSILGSANYDISHVIAGSPFGGGCAGGLKSGLSGGLNIPVTRHEIGHQLAQSHTINNSGNNNYEPENGAWTIQGGNAQSHAHAVSYHQLADFLLNDIPTIGMKVPTANSIPTADAGPDVIIPISTPFTLTGSATDPDFGDSLTYVWDNMNRGIQQFIPVTDDSQGALFMRLLPDTARSRTIPQMTDVVANNNANMQEQLPTQARIIDIRLTVNDNHRMLYNGETINSSGSNSDDIQITVVNSGPFEVTSQNTPGIIYPGGTNQLVTWDVNGTDTLPINTQDVAISLSTDGGYTYPTLLIASTPNDGSQLISLPNISTTSARLRVAATNSVYFDINTTDFEIQMGPNSVEEWNGFLSRIYPNPAKEYVMIEVPAGFNYSVLLYNAQGELITEQLNITDLDISELSGGLYMLSVKNTESNQLIHNKLIIRN